MKRIDVVREGLSRYGREDGVTAGRLAAELGLSRANVSSDLNRLVREGSALKGGVRPVYYRPVEKGAASEKGPRESDGSSVGGGSSTGEEDSLEKFARLNPSMYRCVEQAKAAILYPPHGMHMLLYGPTGVGKSMFAAMIHEYAVSAGIIAADSAFVSFNCADYADNPQLLVSELMGTKRGAYTGADEDRPGLIEKADGGILFLDEVHRLPPQGQEMLFTFIDRGVYRRLGETEAERHAQVLLICATTENPASNLLATFVRRIPMIIEIPSLAERSREERFSLVERFFEDESRRLSLPIDVSVNAVRAFLGYPCRGNVGQLKSDVRIVCARAYSFYVGGRRPRMVVRSRDLPDHVREGLYGTSSRSEVWHRRLSSNRRCCTFDAKNDAVGNVAVIDEDASIYDILDERINQLKLEHADEATTRRLLNDDIKGFFSKYSVTDAPRDSLGSVNNIVSPEVADATDEVLALASQRLGRTFGANVRYGLAAHIASAVLRVHDGLTIANPQFNDIRTAHPDEFSVALEAVRIIEDRFDVEFPLDEAGFMTLFFDLDAFRPRVKVLVVVIAHGASTASSMVETANRLAGMDYAMALDASLDETPAEVYARLVELVRGQANDAGVLLLVDMGSLTDFANLLERDLGIPARVVPLVSTMHVVEASRKAALGAELEEVYKETNQVGILLGVADQPQSRQVAKDTTARAIVVAVCTTGEGGAKLLKELLDGRLNYHKGFAETVTLATGSGEDLSTRLGSIARRGRIVCVTSAFDIDYPVPQIPLSNVLGGDGVQAIQELIDNELNVERLGDTLSGLLHNVNTRKLVPLVIRAVDDTEGALAKTLRPETRVGLVCHLCCMFDRLVGGSEPTSFDGTADAIANDRMLYEALRHTLGGLASSLNVELSDDDLCFSMQFWTPESCMETR